MVIFKYALRPTFDNQEIEMPVGSKVIHVHEQHGNICLWAEVDNNDLSTRTFRVVPTGATFKTPSFASYLGTVHLNGLVLHVYQLASDG